MALIPTNDINIGEDVEVSTQPTYTYYFDIERKRIIGNIDGLEAIKQAIYKILQTERYSYLIYDWDYGIELESLIGKDSLFILAEIERRITEALMQDDRVISITNFNVIQKDKNNFIISFTVNTTEGGIDIEGVNISV